MAQSCPIESPSGGLQRHRKLARRNPKGSESPNGKMHRDLQAE
jgi:hypothetical protein